MRRVMSLLCVFCLISGASCSSDSTKPKLTPPVADDVLGLWGWRDGLEGCFVVERDSSGLGYVGVALSDPECGWVVGRPILEFRWSPERRLFTGRHLWVVCDEQRAYWSVPGRLEITQSVRDRIFVRFLDHMNTYGWRAERIAACGPEPAPLEEPSTASADTKRE